MTNLNSGQLHSPAPDFSAPLKALVIDDDVTSQESLGYILEMLETESESVSSGEKGLARLNERSFDIVFLDLVMPGGANGIEICKEIDKREERPDVVLITALGSKETIFTEAVKLDRPILKKERSLLEKIEQIIAELRQKVLSSKDTAAKVLSQKAVRDLDNGHISEAIRQDFGYSNISLPDNVTISIEERGTQWQVIDRDNEREYIVRREGDKLFIYLKEILESFICNVEKIHEATAYLRLEGQNKEGEDRELYLEYPLVELQRFFQKKICEGMSLRCEIRSLQPRRPGMGEELDWRTVFHFEPFEPRVLSLEERQALLRQYEQQFGD